MASEKVCGPLLSSAGRRVQHDHWCSALMLWRAAQLKSEVEALLNSSARLLTPSTSGRSSLARSVRELGLLPCKDCHRRTVAADPRACSCVLAGLTLADFGRRPNATGASFLRSASMMSRASSTHMQASAQPVHSALSWARLRTCVVCARLPEALPCTARVCAHTGGLAVTHQQPDQPLGLAGALQPARHAAAAAPHPQPPCGLEPRIRAAQAGALQSFCSLCITKSHAAARPYVMHHGMAPALQDRSVQFDDRAGAAGRAQAADVAAFITSIGKPGGSRHSSPRAQCGSAGRPAARCAGCRPAGSGRRPGSAFGQDPATAFGQRVASRGPRCVPCRPSCRLGHFVPGCHRSSAGVRRQPW